MAFCLLPKHRDKFKKALKEGKINPEKLSEMTSAKRRAFLAKYVGKHAAPKVNALFESKLLLKNQKAGYLSWAKSLIGTPKEIRRDLISRIEKLDKVLDPKSEAEFLQDLATQKLGVGEITFKEAQNLSELSSAMEKAKSEGFKDGSWKNDKAKDEYGSNMVAMRKYTDSLMEVAKKEKLIQFMEREGLLGKAGGIAGDLKRLAVFIGENARSIKAGFFDDSFFGRQARKALGDRMTTDLWFKAFGKSFIDMYKTMKGGTEAGENILDAVKADIWSRENAMNGNYNRGKKLDLGIMEEEFPTTLPERIPVIGRLFTSARVAFEAGAMRLRADIADRYYEMAEKGGLDMKNKDSVGDINVFVNSLSGRGNIGRFENIGKELNAMFFSAKFFKSQVDTFTKPFTAKTRFVRRRAFENLMSLVATTGLVNVVAEYLSPNSTEKDPTSADFGKIKIGNTRFDPSGGVLSLMTLASRILTQSKKSSVTGVKKKLGEGFGSQDGTDVFWQTMENKFSPLASVVRDMMNQKTFKGEKPTLNNVFMSLFTPILVESGVETSKVESEALTIAALVADWVGISTNTYTFDDNWNQKTTAEMTKFKKKVGQEEFDKANDEYNQKVHDGITSDEYLKSDEKEDDLNKIKRDAKKKIFKSHGFKP